MSDWFDDLQRACDRLRMASYHLGTLAEGCHILGLETLEERLEQIKGGVDSCEELVSVATANAVNETYRAAQQSSANMLSAALVVCEHGKVPR